MTDSRQLALEALETAKNGLLWYADAHPEDVNGSDDGAMADIDEAISALEADLASKVEPVAEVMEKHDRAGGTFVAWKTLPVSGMLLYAAPQQAEAPGWMTIETAPKDGRFILVNDMNGTASCVAAKWLAGEQWSGWVYEDDLLQDNLPLGPSPTHWMPLPAAPRSEA